MELGDLNIYHPVGDIFKSESPTDNRARTVATNEPCRGRVGVGRDGDRAPLLRAENLGPVFLPVGTNTCPHTWELGLR